MSTKTQTGTPYTFVPLLLAVPALIVFLTLLYPSIKAALNKPTAVKELEIHQRDIDGLVSRKSALLLECDTARTETERIKKQQAEENIKLERAQGSLKTAEEMRKSVVAEQMRFENIQRDLVATNQVYALSVAALRVEFLKLNQDLKTYQTNCEAQKTQMNVLQLEKKSLEDRTIGLSTDIKTSQAQYDQRVKDIQTQKQDYIENEENIRKALSSLRKTEAILAQVTAEVTALKKQNVLLEEATNTLTQAVVEASKQLTVLKTQNAKENETLRTARTEVDAARANAIAYSALLTQVKSETQTEAKRKETLILDSKGLSQAALEAGKRLKDVQAQLAVEAETLKALRSDVDSARAEKGTYLVQAEQLKIDIARMRNELTQLKKEVK
jgi:hypothetical protein